MTRGSPDLSGSLIPATARDDIDEARRAAKDVLQALQEITLKFQALENDHRHRIHGLFSELYVCSAAQWLRLLARQQDSVYQYWFIVEFYDLYRRYVLDALCDPVQEIAPHWRRYHRLARGLTLRSPISQHLLLLSYAIHAHLRFDQGAAMHAVERKMGVSDGDLDIYHRRLFGEMSDVALVGAALDYVEGHKVEQVGWRRGILSFYRTGLFVLKPIWLPTAQRWRRTGYREARVGLSR